jgi:hypothetical protein
MTTARKKQAQPTITATSQPVYELRVVVPRKGEYRVEVWQLPSPVTPRLKEDEQVASLKGQAWRLVEARVLRRLARAGITFGRLTPGTRQQWRIDEDLALGLGLLFRTLAPMRNLDRIRQAADGIEAMSREEASYWLGMAMNRRRPRRVLAALRMLLTET